ncbi:Uncharacterised protein [Bacteroides intestinalis]|uniref:Uncharacterized protein n=1 Tax=Bacteroides intestinalis TaxID=329854 RepID=A0A6N2V9U9_9BACE
MNIHHRARSGTLVRAFPLFGQATELIIQIISPFLGSLRPLVAILGEGQLVRIIVRILHKISTRKYLLRTTSASIIFILKSILAKVRRLLIFGLKHKAKIPLIIIYIIGVMFLAVVHLAGKHRAPLFVGEGIAYVQVFVRSLHYRKFT